MVRILLKNEDHIRTKYFPSKTPFWTPQSDQSLTSSPALVILEFHLTFTTENDRKTNVSFILSESKMRIYLKKI